MRELPDNIIIHQVIKFERAVPHSTEIDIVARQVSLLTDITENYD